MEMKIAVVPNPGAAREPDPGYHGASGVLRAHDGWAARFSRRQLLRRSAVAFGGLAGAGLLDACPAWLGAWNSTVRPVLDDPDRPLGD